MKKIFTLFTFIILVSSSVFSQDFMIGLKAGVNIGHGGEIAGLTSSANYTGDTYFSNPSEGFHGGIFGQYNFGKYFLRLEGMYNTVTTEFPFDIRPAEYQMNKINVPLLLGYHFWGPLDVYLGPAYNSTVGDVTLQGMENNGGVVENISSSYLSANIGVKAHFGRFEVDARYEYNFSSNEPYRIDMINSAYGINLASFESRRIHQLMISVAVGLFDSKYRPQRSKRKRGCYFK